MLGDHSGGMVLLSFTFTQVATKPVRSVDRAVDIVLAFVDNPVVGVAELQQRLELPRPTLYRMLSAFEQKGLVSWFGEFSGDSRRPLLRGQT